MSLQVGAFCYATPVAAAAAACARHVPSVKVDGGNVVSLSCSGVTDVGGLVMSTSVVPVGSSASAVVSTSEYPMDFAPCLYPDFVEAVLAIFAALLALWAITYGPRQVLKLLAWGRGRNDE